MAIDLEKVLITGAEGMVGNYADFGIRTNRRSLDVTDLKEVINIFERYKPQTVIHLAAETDVDRCERDPVYAYLVNAIGAYHVATAAKQYGAKMVYISTAGIFDGTKAESYTPKDKGNPQNYYGRSKYAGELLVRGILSDYIIARVCWMFGGGPSRDQKFVAKIIHQFEKPEIKVVTDQVGSPTFGKDLMGAIKKLIKEDYRGVVNLANEGVCSRYDFAKEIVTMLGAKTKVIPTSLKEFRLDAPRTLNEGLVSSGYTRPWQEALREYLATEWQSFRSHE